MEATAASVATNVSSSSIISAASTAASTPSTPGGAAEKVASVGMKDLPMIVKACEEAIAQSDSQAGPINTIHGKEVSSESMQTFQADLQRLEKDLVHQLSHGLNALQKAVASAEDTLANQLESERNARRAAIAEVRHELVMASGFVPASADDGGDGAIAKLRNTLEVDEGVGVATAQAHMHRFAAYNYIWQDTKGS
eukprot:gnl/TRDRNA2_/TRDRNA2_74890_c0_seq1.p1 gnl/TRDRNA2_/TRDRNA2_74890_c0~~gnl/TRDRNA2_/TRDRNA2_74890_c0_seq1.p1  ORF type:complete len:207 (+),score=38.81 gnl/TRDRNA2_/TRDRNA2_74890_c0_seq1:36-623(+)